MNANSRSTWGRRQERTEAELEAECGKFFGLLVVPHEWKFKGYDRCPDKSTGLDVLSVGAIYLDTRTKGFNVKYYRVFLNIYSLMGGIVEKTTDGRQQVVERKTCILMNKSIDAVNEFIYNEYHRLERQHKYWKLPRTVIRKRT